MSFRPYDVLIAQAQAAGNAVKYSLLNNTGSPLAAFTPVCLDSSGNIKTIDVSIEVDALRAIGITEDSILNATAGEVMNTGKIENITGGYSFGDTVWVSKAGGLTTTAPEVGVGGFLAGDFVIKVGSVAKNQTNPLNKDLIVRILLQGQLQ